MYVNSSGNVLTYGGSLGGSALSDFFITPKQKAHIEGGDTKCWRQCGFLEANHWHIFWECPVIKPFWDF